MIKSVGGMRLFWNRHYSWREHLWRNQTILKEKVREALASVLPITAIVLLLCFTIAPVSNTTLLAFLIGAVLLIVGMGLFTLGADIAMSPIGERVGAAMTRSRKLWVVIGVGFLIGVIVTASEPDLQVLATQVPGAVGGVYRGAGGRDGGTAVLMERKKLLAALKQLKVETGRLACLGCGHEHDCGIHGCAIIREAVAQLTKSSEWISVGDRMPEPGVWVLVCCGTFVCEAYWAITSGTS